MREVTYARAGVTPDWTRFHIVDLDTGRNVARVIEVDTTAGFLVRVRTDEQGKPVMKDGSFVHERVEGRFKLVRDATAAAA